VSLAVFVCVFLGALSLSAATNPIILENQQPGSADWGILTAGHDMNLEIKGYASATSVVPGQTISFSVTVTPAQTYTIDIFRMGWYQGLGGRLMQHVGPIAGKHQAVCPGNSSTGLRECAWVPDTSITIPGTWTTGVYLALLTNAKGFQNYMTFVVRDDSRKADFLYQQSVTTYQAYNNYPDDGRTGKSLYDYNSYGSNTVAGTPRAVKVSFNRPYTDLGDGQFTQYEIYFVQWMESQGYDVSYSTDVDTHANGSALLSRKAFLSLGHDEYWSGPMRTAVEQARNSGVSLGFFGANIAYWQVRFEPSALNGIANRVLVCYKDQTIDPVQGPTTTVQFRDPLLNLPEQSLLGIMSSAVSNSSFDQPPLTYVVTNSSHWAYAGTGFVDGSTVPQIVGYETDRQFSEYPLPSFIPGTYTLLSHSPVTDIYTGLADYQNASVYQAPSGAWVFAAGSIDWSWALLNPGYVSPGIQQMTRNVLNRFLGVGAPNAPTALGASAVSATEIDLRWTANSTNETGFVVERSLTNTFAPITSFNVAVGQTVFQNTGLTGGTTYFYRVKAINTVGSSAYSNITSATPAGVPAAPSILTAAVASATQINLGWTDNSNNENNFVVERSFTNSFTAVTSITLPANQTTYSDMGLTTGTTYFYRVKATNAIGSSGYSNTVSTTPDTAPAAPSNLSATAASTTQINLAWTDNSNNESNFVLQRSLTNAFTAVTSFTLPANQIVYSDTGLTAGTAYFYRVKATNAVGSSTYSNPPASATTNPAPLTITPATLGNAVIGVAYSAVLTVTGGSGPFSWTISAGALPAGLGINATSGLISGTPSSTGTFSFAVKVTNAAQSGSVNYSITVAAGAVPAVPGGVKVTAGNAQVTLSWTASAGATSYIVRRATVSGGPYTQVGSPTAASFPDTGLTNGTTFYYVVAAVNANGASGNSMQVSATPTATKIALVQSAHTLWSPTAAFSVNNTAGNTIIVSVSWTYSAKTTISDSRGNKYVALPEFTGGVPGALANQIFYYATNIKAGANTITIAGPADTDAVGITIAEYSGIAATNTLGITSTIAAPGLTTTPKSNVFTPSTSGSLILAAFADQGYTQSAITAGAGYTMVLADGNHADALEAATNLPLTPQTAAFGLVNPTDIWVIYVAEFRAGP
jgi:fibronectin type 3 domain-containing protein